MAILGNVHHNLDYHVYQAVKEMIISRKLAPGMKILQDNLAKELGISRTPLVNALKRLEHEKLILAVSRRGYFVRLFTQLEMIQIFEIREVLEGLTARRTAIQGTDEQLKRVGRFFAEFQGKDLLGDVKRYAREDREFHNYLISAGEAGMITDLLDSFNFITLSYQLTSQEGLVRPPKKTYAEHIAIIKAIQKRDGDQAERLMRRHIRISLKWLEKQVYNNKPAV
ncbi:MAG: GntR family transcriptional regulator [Candidatus Aminicenantales bacterium]|jgi:DNA-binding GntR family transcriptional regulator